MVRLTAKGVYLVDGTQLVTEDEAQRLDQMGVTPTEREHAREGTIAHSILAAHTVTDDLEHLRIKFDAMASHDITYVGIIQTARASGMERFPLPYVLTCCHNSLCAVGGTRRPRSTVAYTYRPTSPSSTSSCARTSPVAAR